MDQTTGQQKCSNCGNFLGRAKKKQVGSPGKSEAEEGSAYEKRYGSF
jgi:hypothetical protein